MEEERRLHGRQVGLQSVWRSLILCCCGQHQENLHPEALIVVPVREILMQICSFNVNLVFCVDLPANVTNYSGSGNTGWGFVYWSFLPH